MNSHEISTTRYVICDECYTKNLLTYVKWKYKYHITFMPMYRQKIIYNQYKEDIRDIIKQLCGYKGVKILEGNLMPDYIHMLVGIPLQMSISLFMRYLKGKSILMIFDKHTNLKIDISG